MKMLLDVVWFVLYVWLLIGGVTVTGLLLLAVAQWRNARGLAEPDDDRLLLPHSHDDRFLERRRFACPHCSAPLSFAPLDVFLIRANMKRSPDTRFECGTCEGELYLILERCALGWYDVAAVKRADVCGGVESPESRVESPTKTMGRSGDGERGG